MGHIAILSHTFFPVVGGAEIGIHELARRLAREHEVTVVTAMPEGSAQAHSAIAPEPDGYAVLRYPGALWATSRLGWLRLRLAWREYRVLRELHRRRPLTAVNIHFAGWYGIAALWIRLLLRVPVTLSLVGRTDVYRDLAPGARLHLRICVALASRTTQITRYCLEGWRGGAGVPELPYGVDTAAYRPRSGPVGDPVRLVAVQRLSAVKRVDALLAAIEALELAAPGRYRLLVVGTGPEEPALRAIAGAGAAAIEFAGFVAEDELPAVLAASDVFVTHTMSETFGVVFAEAMAAGLPIVAAAATSVPYVVVDGRNGLLAEPFDAEGFAERVRRIAEDPALHARISTQNRAEAVERYDWDRVAARLLELMPQRR